MVATAPVTVEQAAAILGVSGSTVRRRIRAGSLRAEEVRRPQGVVWLVHLPDDAEPAPAQMSSPAAPVATAPAAPGDAMAAWAASLLVPIAAELGEARQVIVAQAEKLEAQAERVGRLTAELDAARAADLLWRRNIRRLLLALAVLAGPLLLVGTLVAAGWAR